ncbi:hypothetical protein CH380_10500 [Leptospira adleri]|uniref:Uncharacterized protein n=1 Tax=Leptospira adleri TaxID=2023186 RepID=A0A2M9YNW0_9LEPT|nr:hypothetical protein CH380_10500 [Leptospira adleri]PJZ63960.1 hypothetical protein CH376_00610 [Leptospira adleri]
MGNQNFRIERFGISSKKNHERRIVAMDFLFEKIRPSFQTASRKKQILVSFTETDLLVRFRRFRWD